MKTSIKTKFRPSTVRGKAGTVYYQLIHGRQVARINTDIRIQPQEWNSLLDEKTTVGGMLQFIQQRITRDTEKLEAIIKVCREGNKEYSVRTIVDLYKEPEGINFKTGAVHDGVTPTSNHSFFTFMRGCIKELAEENRHGTVVNYRHALNSLSSFAGSGDITLTMMNDGLVARYEAWLKTRGLKRNSTSFYMRILRAVYNRAVRQGLVRQAFPFRNVYTGIDRTRKRAVEEAALTTLNRLDLTDKPGLRLARDMFMFSFATCGMPFVDMAYLRKSDVQAGYIRYERRKTRQSLQVKVLPIVEDIIRRYADERAVYVFPVLTSTAPDAAYRQYRNALIDYNRRLHKLSAMLPVPVCLTSYVSRHSWATIARNHGNSVSRIGRALGHTSETTTEIYLAAIGESEIDEMNKEITGCLQS